MQAMYLLDQTVNIHTAPAAWREQCKPVLDAAGEITEWIIPKGAIVSGTEALLRVSTGQCSPFDDECAVACGRSSEELAVTQRQYLAAEKGIKGKKDMELFMAGVIDGYDKGTTDAKPIYIHGPNWSAFESAQAEVKKTESKI